jgi:hypothetical protein
MSNYWNAGSLKERSFPTVEPGLPDITEHRHGQQPDLQVLFDPFPVETVGHTG